MVEDKMPAATAIILSLFIKALDECYVLDLAEALVYLCRRELVVVVHFACGIELKHHEFARAVALVDGYTEQTAERMFVCVSAKVVFAVTP